MGYGQNRRVQRRNRRLSEGKGSEHSGRVAEQAEFRGETGGTGGIPRGYGRNRQNFERKRAEQASTGAEYSVFQGTGGCIGGTGG